LLDAREIFFGDCTCIESLESQESKHAEQELAEQTNTGCCGGDPCIRQSFSSSTA
jgi:hypothetical protein